MVKQNHVYQTFNSSTPSRLPTRRTTAPIYRAFWKSCFSIFEKKVQMGYCKEQMSLVIMDTCKGQDNDEMRKFCAKNSCEIAIIPRNLTKKFQLLDISVNKAPSLLFLTNTILGLPMKCRNSWELLKFLLNSLLSSHYMRSGL